MQVWLGRGNLKGDIIAHLEEILRTLHMEDCRLLLGNRLEREQEERDKYFEENSVKKKYAVDGAIEE